MDFYGCTKDLGEVNWFFYVIHLTNCKWVGLPLYRFFLNNSKSTSFITNLFGISTPNLKLNARTSLQIVVGNQTVGIYLFKIKNESTTAICEICSKLTIKTPK